jgi:hypothetical protein
MPTHEGLGPDDREDLQDRRKPAIKENKEPAIIVGKPDATMEPAPHDIQLMSKHRVLSFKPQLRLEWRGQHGQNETEQPDHSTSLGDSITASTRIRFSVHTGGRGVRRCVARLACRTRARVSARTAFKRSGSRASRSSIADDEDSNLIAPWHSLAGQPRDALSPAILI